MYRDLLLQVQFGHVFNIDCTVDGLWICSVPQILNMEILTLYTVYNRNVTLLDKFIWSLREIELLCDEPGHVAMRRWRSPLLKLILRMLSQISVVNWLSVDAHLLEWIKLRHPLSFNLGLVPGVGYTLDCRSSFSEPWELRVVCGSRRLWTESHPITTLGHFDSLFLRLFSLAILSCTKVFPHSLNWPFHDTFLLI